jgi:hypothetical protein
LKQIPHGTWSVYVDSHPKREASNRQPSSLFSFRGLEAVIRNKATSLVVVVTALPFRAATVPFRDRRELADPCEFALRNLARGPPTRTRTQFDSLLPSQHCSSCRLLRSGRTNDCVARDRSHLTTSRATNRPIKNTTLHRIGDRPQVRQGLPAATPAQRAGTDCAKDCPRARCGPRQ